MMRQMLIVMSIVLIAIALAIWAIRPPVVWDWLGMPTFGLAPPHHLIATWIRGGLAPMTPVGFLSLFPVWEVGILGALLAALVILVVMLLSRRSKHRLKSWIEKPVSLNRLPRIATRVRTAMVLIAILGLDLGWEIVAWRNWRVSERYRGQADRYAQEGTYVRDILQSLSRALAEDGEVPSQAPSRKAKWTPAARAADRAYYRDQLKVEIALFTDRGAALVELQRKYERAAQNPTALLPPDPQLPMWPQRPLFLVEDSGYAEALARFDDLIRHYPELVRAHQYRAMILASCPDSNFRDGRRAIASAMRAAELSDWNDPYVLSTLAAAHAEAGEFAAAIYWEQRALELFFNKQNPEGDRMPLYKAGKPYRMKGRGVHVEHINPYETYRFKI